MVLDYFSGSAEKRTMDQARALRRLAAWRTKTKETLADWLQRDTLNAGIWTPVVIGTGIGIYFGLPSEPSLLVLGGGLISFVVLSVFLRRWHKLFAVVSLLALGLFAAALRTEMVSAPVLDKDIGIKTIEGKVVSVERSSRGERFVIALTNIERFGGDELPARARISWRGEASDIRAGDQISLRAGLGPPPAPATPGGFHFARQLYFQKIGAVGYGVSQPERLARSDTNAFNARLENIRAHLLERITKAAPGQGGAIVAAVVTGKREAISEESRNALRDAGLAHLLAISGLHMGLATGIIFFSVRALLAGVHPIAVRYPIKKWAAAAAILSGFAYLMLSGASWSPRRAFIMTAIIFAAILFDRRALSLRNVAIAATVILLTTPEAIVHPGFQMSFAAATALIAAFEFWGRYVEATGRINTDYSVTAKIKRYAIGIGVTDSVAALATAPFALYHFNRVAIFSLPANLIAMPIMAFWIMPAAVIGIFLSPIGFDQLAWRVAASGVDVVIAVSTEVSSWPGAVSLTPQWPVAALVIIVSGGLWLLLARSPLRLLGFAALPLTFLIVKTAPSPDLFVADSGANVGVAMNGRGDAIVPFSMRRDRFSVGVWNEVIGIETQMGERKRITDIARCDESGCVLSIKGRLISILEERSMLAEDCIRADLVVAMVPIADWDQRDCAARLIDKRSAWREGAHAVWINQDDIVIKSVASVSGNRPWSKNYGSKNYDAGGKRSQ